MAINNITQTISTIPEAARRGVDVQTQFVIKQEDFQDHLQGTTVTELNTFKDQLNSRIGEINSTTTTMNGYADIASAGASTATTKAGEASTSAGEALTSRNQASTFATNSSNSATKASQWADNNYNVEVETGKYSAKHWSTVAQNTVSGKVDKVTSTDNAIVRFNGTTGAIQNSGVTIDDNNNIGIGVTPSAWGSTFKATQIGLTANVVGKTNDEIIYTGSNFYNDGTNWKYSISGNYASMYAQDSGVHRFYTAPSGTAGNAITWTNAMTLSSSGNLLVGTTTDNGVDKLQVSGIASASRFRSNRLTISAVVSTWVNISTLPDGLHIITQSDFNAAAYGACMIVLVAEGTAFIVSNTGSATILRMSGVTAQINFPITMAVVISITTLN